MGLRCVGGVTDGTMVCMLVEKEMKNIHNIEEEII